MILEATLPAAEHLAQAGEQDHGLSLRIGQYGEDVGTCAHETILAGDTLCERRHDRLPVERYTMSFGHKGHNVGNVQWAPGAPEYVVCHVYLRHTLYWLCAGSRRFRTHRATQAAKRIQLGLRNSLEDLNKVVANVIGHLQFS
jgi:hypothetical protein